MLILQKLQRILSRSIVEDFVVLHLFPKQPLTVIFVYAHEFLATQGETVRIQSLRSTMLLYEAVPAWERADGVLYVPYASLVLSEQCCRSFCELGVRHSNALEDHSSKSVAYTFP
jgi:hypothetical protein